MPTDAELKNIDTVARAFDALSRRDVATLASIFHAEACWRVPATGVLKGNYRGRDQILGFFAHLAHETDGTFRTEPIALTAAGHRVYAHNEVTATRKGATSTWHNVLIFEFYENVATNVHQFMLDYPAIRRFWA